MRDAGVDDGRLLVLQAPFRGKKMKNKLRLGVVGLGQRGGNLLRDTLTKLDTVVIAAVCDAYQDRVDSAVNAVREKCGYAPKGYTDYREMFASKDVDAVIVASSWESHIAITIDALYAGLITGMEVGGAYTHEECYELVKAYEKTRTPFMFLENCCYDRSEMLAMNMAADGLFGNIVHCSGAYGHDLREEIAFGKQNRHYRLDNYILRNCENYPTHELGPIAKMLNINNGNRMVSLTSVASKAAGLKSYIKSNADCAALQNTDFAQGDVVTTVIKCAGGESIQLKLDTTLPRYYDRELVVRGTRGLYNQTLNAVFFDGDKQGHYSGYENAAALLGNAEQYTGKYLPDYWKNITNKEKESGHGGMDFFMMKDFVARALAGKPMPIDVYDAAAWMSVTYLSEQSIALGGAVMFPDYTNGKWVKYRSSL
jgi:hypothetical protein